VVAWDWSPRQLAALARFLQERGLTCGPVRAVRIGDGHSNLTYRVIDEAGATVVVRRPPPPPTPPGAHDVLREARLISALGGSAVPVAPVLATASAGEVLDVPLYVMGYVDGVVVTAQTPPPLDSPSTRRRIGHALVDTLAALHSVDWRAAGLAELGRPEGFNSRHVHRMARLIADDAGRVPDEFADVRQWLLAHVPVESGAAIVHNDFRIPNVMLSTRRPGEVAAVLDWELATIGDPLFDLGYFLASVPREEPFNPTQAMGIAMLEAGYPSRQELAERYAQRTGADLTHLPWYTVLALWKLAVLYEYSHRRARQGTGDPYYLDRGLVHAFLDDARRSAGLVSSSPASTRQE